MKVKEKLEHLYNYYLSTRGVGHTSLMMEGLLCNTSKSLVLTPTRKHFDSNFKGLKGVGNISWFYLNLNGYQRPLAIDNSAMEVILSDTLKEINRLEEQNKKLLSIIKHLEEIIG